MFDVAFSRNDEIMTTLSRSFFVLLFLVKFYLTYGFSCLFHLGSIKCLEIVVVTASCGQSKEEEKEKQNEKKIVDGNASEELE